MESLPSSGYIQTPDVYSAIIPCINQLPVYRARKRGILRLRYWIVIAIPLWKHLWLSITLASIVPKIAAFEMSPCCWIIFERVEPFLNIWCLGFAAQFVGFMKSENQPKRGNFMEKQMVRPTCERWARRIIILNIGSIRRIWSSLSWAMVSFLGSWFCQNFPGFVEAVNEKLHLFEWKKVRAAVLLNIAINL